MRNSEKGSGLIVVILVIAFMMTIGIAVLTVTSTSSQVAGNVRNQEEAFNAAEAGFEAARQAVSEFLGTGAWEEFEGHYLKDLKDTDHLDLPAHANYFRTKTDQELLDLITQTPNPNVIFHEQPYVVAPSGQNDPRFVYTAFLIDDEAGNVASDPLDVLLVSIGAVRAGSRIVATSRLEVVLASQESGTNP